MQEFKNRVFGCVIVKAINSNYNADFTHQPRTLPDGVVYATDKTLKYSVRHYLKNNFPNENILFYKKLNNDLNPLTLAEAYEDIFDELLIDNKTDILKNLLSCLDVRFFGATFAAKKSQKEKVNISIHGPVQINHGVNRFSKNEIYSEQIMSPFRNPGDEGSEEKEMTTLGQQSKLREGHYVHHFSINPQNLNTVVNLANDANGLTISDISKLKESMRCGVTYYDSASKAGTDNELLLWIQMNENSKIVLPVFTEMISVIRNNEFVTFDFINIKGIIEEISEHIEKIEVFYNPLNTNVENLPEKTKKYKITNLKEI